MILEVTQGQADLIKSALRLYAEECREAAHRMYRGNDAQGVREWTNRTEKALALVDYIERVREWTDRTEKVPALVDYIERVREWTDRMEKALALVDYTEKKGRQPR